MTVIVQPSTDSNGNPQPMVYDSDTGKMTFAGTVRTMGFSVTLFPSVSVIDMV